MKLLAIDTATTACSAALWADGRIVAERAAAMERGQAEALMPMVAEVIAAARPVCPNGFADLDLVAVTTGPGAFTGVRIGLAAAAGMAAAAGIPAVGFTTLEVVAAAQPRTDRPLLIALDSKRSDVYCQLFAAGGERALTEPAAVLPADLPGRLPEGPLALAGDGAGRAEAALAAAGRDVLRLAGRDRPEAAVLARLAAARLAGRVPPPGAAPKPLYLRAPDVSLPAAGG